MGSNDWQTWFEDAWREREESIYASLFGDLGPGIYPLDFELFNSVFGSTEVDPRWLHIGVFESPPNERRKGWLYVSSGLSNAWEADHPDANSWSGLGLELLLQCNEQSPWALSLLRKLTAYQLLLRVGRFGEKQPLDCWDRMQTGAPIDCDSSELQALLFVPSVEFPGPHQLSSGRFEFLQIIGVTIAELEYGRANGYDTLHEKLVAGSASPQINPLRGSVI